MTKNTKCVVLVVLALIEVFIVGKYESDLMMGIDFGVNSYCFTRKSKSGFHPSFYPELPYYVEIVDKQGITFIGPTPSQDENMTFAKEIDSYAIERDSLFVQISDNEKKESYILRFRDGQYDVHEGEMVKEYPQNAYVIQIKGNLQKLRGLYLSKNVLRFFIFIILLCQIILALPYGGKNS